ncbi:MAG: large conductance mechanosensitive channel protein MscL [Candidatus Eremiobacteraeota bacterium]|nr:large conductance mechanosensitive channel protein MscL [Candidatus Eremiobacteraeota bacterium]MBV8356296.1 large conductance mechanosensitive channel protein MscL [Candidatus Eremiobacteraeota bacterium]
MLKGFREFVMRGNVIDLAVGVVMGAAFGAVVTALVKDLLTPLLGAIFGKRDFGALAFEINGSRFAYGDFINALISFFLIAVGVYYFVILPMNMLTSWRRRGDEATTKACPECMNQIALAARRCMYCTASVF